MRKEVKVFLGIFIFSILIINLIGYVAAEETIAGQFWGKVTNEANSVPFEKTASSPIFAKFLLFLLVTLIVFAILELFPFLQGRRILTFWVSVIVGILSIFYLQSTEVYSILLSYGALGITLTVILPFALVFFMSLQLHQANLSFMSRVAWVVFGVVLFFRWIFADLSQIGVFGKWAYPIGLLLVLILFIEDRQLYRLFLSQETSDRIDRFGQQVRLQNARRNAEAPLNQRGRPEERGI